MKYAERVAQVLAEGGEQPAMQWDGGWLTWAQLAAGANAVSAALAASGAPADAAAALVLRNRPAAVAALLALGSARRCAVLVSPIQPPTGLAGDVTRATPAVVVADAQDWTPELVAAVEGMGAAGIECSAGPGGLTARLRSAFSAVSAPSAPKDAGIIVPTSGTTGPPKRIPLTWRWLDAFAPREPTAEVKFEDPRALIIAAPLVTITGLRPLLTWATRPLKVALMERLDVNRWAKLVAEHKPKIAGLPPAAMRMMLESEIDAADLASLRGWHTGSAPLDADVAEAFEDRFGVPVLTAYGATEFGGPVAGWTSEDRAAHRIAKRGSTGRFYDDCAGRVVDPETGAPLPPGETGLLEVTAPRALVPTTDGWIRTSDLARIDEDGFLFILGRTDDVIIRGGFKVPLPEIEAALESHPAVWRAACSGLVDERLGQVPAAAVVLQPGAPAPSEAQLIAWVRDRLAPYKAPVIVVTMAEIPTTASMKVAKAALREALTAEQVRRTVAN